VNPIAVAIVAWVFIGLDAGLRDAFALGKTGIAPSFVIAFVTFIAMYAPAPAALWSALIIGLALDLLFQVPGLGGGPALTIVGPRIIAAVVGVWLVLTLRGLMIRRNPLTLGFLAGLVSLVWFAALAGLFALRHAISNNTAVEPSRVLMEGLGSSLYTALVAALLALVLMPLAPFMGFATGPQNKFGRRG